MRSFKLVLAAVAVATVPAQAQDVSPSDRYAIPSTVSPEAADRLKLIYSFLRGAPRQMEPASVADWDRNRAQADAFGVSLSKPVVDALKVTVAEERMGGVPVLRVRPASWKPTGRTLVFIHGGGYVTGSAAASTGDAARMAASTGNEVISIDYTVAPRGRWQSVTDEVLAVWQALLKSGAAPQSIGFFGGSAGGGLVAGAVLKMRDKGLPLPGALYLQSPWSDITATGETITTLAAAEPLLSSESLAWGANAYADPKDQKNPYVSPIYGDYTKAFPPTLIQVGTREIFLSHAVRHYQAIRSGGHEAILDVYEGMTHGFPSLFGETPEGATAIARASEFFASRLKPAGGNR